MATSDGLSVPTVAWVFEGPERILAFLIQQPGTKFCAVLDADEEVVGVAMQVSRYRGNIYQPNDRQVGKFGPASPIEQLKIRRALSNSPVTSGKCVGIINDMHRDTALLAEFANPNLKGRVAGLFGNWPAIGTVPNAFVVGDSDYYRLAMAAGYGLLFSGARFDSVGPEPTSTSAAYDRGYNDGQTYSNAPEAAAVEASVVGADLLYQNHDAADDYRNGFLAGWKTAHKKLPGETYWG